MRNLLFIALTFTIRFFFGQSGGFLPFSPYYNCLDRSKPVTSMTQTIKPVKNMVVRDFDGNGFDDVLHVDTAGATFGLSRVLVYYNQGNQTFIEVTVGLTLGMIKAHSADAGDFDDDGDDDIILAFGDSLKIYTNNGGMSFTNAYGVQWDVANLYRNAPIYVKAGNLNSD